MTPGPRSWLGRDRSDVFISYRREEAPLARELDRYLRERGLTTWIDSGSLLPGVRWATSVETAIRYTALFLAVTTPSYRDSGPCKKEYDHAREVGKYIVCAGTAPWHWDGWDEAPGAVVVEGVDGAAVYDALKPRLALGRLQADLEQAAETFAAQRSIIPSFQGRAGLRRARDTLAGVRRAGLPVTNSSVSFARSLRRRLMGWRALIVAVGVTVSLGGAVWLSSYTHVGRELRTSESSRQERHRTAESQSLAAEMVREQNSGSVPESRLLDLAVRAYDQAPTPAAIAALRAAVMDAPPVEDLRAVALPGRVIAVRLTADGRTAGLTAEGTFRNSDGKVSRVWRPKNAGERLRSGWITPDGGTALVLTGTGVLETTRTVLATGVEVAATDDDQGVYAVARGTTLRLYERPVYGPVRLRCTLRRPAEVTALALSPAGDAMAVGQRGEVVAVVNTATCAVRTVPQPAKRFGLPGPLDPTVAVAVANGGRVVGYATRGSASTAIRGPGGRYSVSDEGGSSGDVRLYLSADGAVTASSYGSFVPTGTSPDRTVGSLPLPMDGLTRVTAAQFSRGADGRWRCVAGTASGALLSMTLQEPGKALPHPVGLSADGVLTTTADQPWKRSAVLTDRPAQGRTRTWRGPRHGLTWTRMSALLAAPRGKVAAVVGTKGTVTVLGPDAPPATVTVHGPAALTPTGRYLFSVENDRVRRWRVGLPRLRRSASVEIASAPAGPAVAVTALDENRIAVARLDGTLEIVELSTGAVTARTTGEVGVRLASSFAGDRLAVVTAHRLQLRDSRLRLIREVPLTGASDVRFAPDGTMVTVSTSSAAQAYSVPGLFSLLDRPVYGSDAVAFPTLPYRGGALLPDGTPAAVCTVCSAADPDRLRDAARSVLSALRLAGD